MRLAQIQKGMYKAKLERHRSEWRNGTMELPNIKIPRGECQFNFVSRDTVIFPVIEKCWNMNFNNNELNI